jgi:hypothetical protein
MYELVFLSILTLIKLCTFAVRIVINSFLVTGNIATKLGMEDICVKYCGLSIAP